MQRASMYNLSTASGEFTSNRPITHVSKHSGTVNTKGMADSGKL